MKPYAEKFYKGKAWIKCRNAYYIDQHGICERCKEAGLIVHHKQEITPENINDPNITLNWDNLELLCQTCHNKEHGNGEAVNDGYTFDDNGDLIKLY